MDHFSNMINFNSSMGEWLHHHKVWDEIDCPLPTFNGVVEDWVWMNNLISHFTIHVIIIHTWSNDNAC